ncbi:methyltransferase type 12 [Clostridium botulinum]|uniref:Class I SAM-dependent methyltransferase n=1 Tax=Clostridium botulinum TaxID=1491 RepID=A0A6B4FJY6_CLOBO|nr:class I SAM-dependent methyltransferase [Clostridium botulinum]ACD51395.1 methyltransferase type 12 [Clostridium botulinum E3 str. Alaska E43]AJF28818.1 methyltransferase type 12 [Clostridium botulinum]AJF31879.1 methyltransferase type 12 [Clostridium botulinum]EES50107.1 methyltransferase type 12 [Clostridium botulinum E1 str. 'BoNT E Beluga']MBN1070268.1 class I SAM-dependent methyltransferase [Clostridium botulinum]
MVGYNIVVDEKFGYKMLDPIPSELELNEFYEKQYYEYMKKNETQSMGRFVNDNKSAELELDWLKRTEYQDSYLIINKQVSNGSLLDIGCGTAEFLSYMQNNGYDVVGIEPSKIAYEKAISKKLQVYNCGLDEFMEKNKKFDIINMTNVLEHIPNPQRTISQCKMLLNTGGIIRIKVPNDFNELQLQIVEKTNKNKWWIAEPDHINYFNFETLINLLNHEGFKVINKTVDFPMEFFMLMGEDYIKNKELGKLCHEKRRNFELNIDGNLRRKIYSAYAEIGIGRNLIIYAKLEL